MTWTLNENRSLPLSSVVKQTLPLRESRRDGETEGGWRKEDEKEMRQTESTQGAESKAGETESERGGEDGGMEVL